MHRHAYRLWIRDEMGEQQTATQYNLYQVTLLNIVHVRWWVHVLNTSEAIVEASGSIIHVDR